MNKPKTWIEVSIFVSSYVSEVLENFLFENGCVGCEEAPNTVLAYFPKEVDFKRLKKIIVSYVKHLHSMGLSVGKPRFRLILDQDWNHQWTQYFTAIQISPRIVVKPPWEEWKLCGDEIVIDIMPKTAFGTGYHETTQLCLMFLEKYFCSSDAVLDIGTGSGILAIAAAKFGATKVLAVDSDEEAIDNARENIVRNCVEDDIEIHFGSIEHICTQPFDIILANIHMKVIVYLLPHLKNYTEPTSKIILSGFLKEEKSQLESMVAFHGFQLKEMKTKEDWLGVVIEPIGGSGNLG